MKRGGGHRRTNRSAFAERLCALREENQLSPTELGARVGLHETTIRRFERDERKPAEGSVRALAAGLGVSMDYLLRGVEEGARTVALRDPELVRLFHGVVALEEDDRAVVGRLLEAFLLRGAARRAEAVGRGRARG